MPHMKKYLENCENLTGTVVKSLRKSNGNVLFRGTLAFNGFSIFATLRPLPSYVFSYTNH